MIPDLFEHYHVNVLEGHNSPQLSMERPFWTAMDRKELEADTFVIAVGFRPAPSIAQELSDCGAAVYEIGDQQQVNDSPCCMGWL